MLNDFCAQSLFPVIESFRSLSMKNDNLSQLFSQDTFQWNFSVPLPKTFTVIVDMP